jgi:EAL domain-containing protein (putative c-di-GMP-specific phosphodiesterase class I)
MYASKRDGKSRVTLFHDDMHELARVQLELRMDLVSALERHELALVYQPIVDTRTQRIGGVEALIRWHHPVRGTVSPLDFIPIAEQSGLIRPIGAWVLRTACTEAATWSADGAGAYISVNVSAPQLTEPSFVEMVEEVLADTRLAPRRLLLEITESMLVDDVAEASSALARLRARGVRVAIDDFGTGYSSLSYLRSMSADVVKIDQSFIRDLSVNADHQALTRSILSLVDGLEMTAIAEGVETEQDYAALSQMGCAYAQGYLFSRPVGADQLRDLLAGFAWRAGGEGASGADDEFAA